MLRPNENGEFLIASVTIRKDRETGEFVCRAYLADGSRYGRADTEETDREAAEATAHVMLAPYRVRVANEERELRSEYRDWQTAAGFSGRLVNSLGRVEVTLRYSDGRTIVEPAWDFERWIENEISVADTLGNPERALILNHVARTL